MTQRLLVAGGTEATRYSSPGCYAEPGDSRANVEKLVNWDFVAQQFSKASSVTK